MRLPTPFGRDVSATAGVEMALIAPMLAVLMLGVFELGNLFYTQHALVEAVRDGARYASRLSFTNFSCSGGASGAFTGSSADVAQVARTGSLDPAAAPRIGYWTAGYDTPRTTIGVSVRCSPTSDYAGIYRGMTGGVPSVTVTADFRYRPLFEQLGLASSQAYLRAESEAAVAGL